MNGNNVRGVTRATALIAMVFAAVLALVSGFSIFYGLAADTPASWSFGGSRASVWVVAAVTALAAAGLFVLGIKLLRADRR